MNDLLERADSYAKSGRGRLSTGYLLLAILNGTGTAAKTLSLRGLSETQVRGGVREAEPEPAELLGEVIRKAEQYAASLGVPAPSALHVLAAITSLKDCEANRILREAGFQVDVIRNQALRNMTTGLTREHGSTGPGAEKRGTCLGAQGDPLPLHAQLKLGDAPQKAPEIQEPAPQRQPLRHAPPGMGSMIETAQRNSRRARPDQASLPVSPSVPPPSGVAPARTPARSVTLSSPSLDARFDLDAADFPILSTLGRNLTLEAALGDLDEIVGRDREMEQMADILNKRKANSPCLVGPPGVGKTAVVQGLALKLARGQAPGLDDKILVELRPADLLSGTSLRGALSERLDALTAEVALSEGRVILFFDEIHALLSSSDGAEAVQELKAALGRGDLHCIAATTTAEYTRYVESDPALARRFSVMEIEEPPEEEAIRILAGIEPSYAAHHGVTYRTGATEAAVRLSARYQPSSALPDKAIALLDLAGARARRSGATEVTDLDIARVLAERIGVPAGRLGVTEMMPLDDHIREMLILGKSSDEIKEYARDALGMMTLWEDGLQKFLQGETTLDEVRLQPGGAV